MASLIGSVEQGVELRLYFTADGEINICEPGTIEGVAQVVAAARSANPPITTHIIGVFPPDGAAHPGGP